MWSNHNLRTPCMWCDDIFKYFFVSPVVIVNTSSFPEGQGEGNVEREGAEEETEDVEGGREGGKELV
ncbi:hypothetical protein CBR_g54845 [Chara braunii]|uniref:Uncharacterized protein n=1 Tax=Chara braunii TaxID=69332 RepID=A0A388JPV2_CHABU|nr:hypothetical protein CBR_g54845 [Chara braunii]|eukprot:GBG59742.1 hypothetical protein CBR_g54845 [Chara braunii]